MLGFMQQSSALAKAYFPQIPYTIFLESLEFRDALLSRKRMHSNPGAEVRGYKEQELMYKKYT